MQIFLTKPNAKKLQPWKQSSGTLNSLAQNDTNGKTSTNYEREGKKYAVSLQHTYSQILNRMKISNFSIGLKKNVQIPCTDEDDCSILHWKFETPERRVVHIVDPLLKPKCRTDRRCTNEWRKRVHRDFETPARRGVRIGCRYLGMQSE